MGCILVPSLKCRNIYHLTWHIRPWYIAFTCLWLMPSYSTRVVTASALSFSMACLWSTNFSPFFWVPCHCSGTYPGVLHLQYMVNPVPLPGCNYCAYSCCICSLVELGHLTLRFSLSICSGRHWFFWFFFLSCSVVLQVVLPYKRTDRTKLLNNLTFAWMENFWQLPPNLTEPSTCKLKLGFFPFSWPWQEMFTTFGIFLDVDICLLLIFCSLLKI